MQFDVNVLIEESSEKEKNKRGRCMEEKVRTLKLQLWMGKAQGPLETTPDSVAFTSWVSNKSQQFIFFNSVGVHIALSFFLVSSRQKEDQKIA